MRSCLLTALWGQAALFSVPHVCFRCTCTHCAGSKPGIVSKAQAAHDAIKASARAAMAHAPTHPPPSSLYVMDSSGPPGSKHWPSTRPLSISAAHSTNANAISHSNAHPTAASSTCAGSAPDPPPAAARSSSAPRRLSISPAAPLVSNSSIGSGSAQPVSGACTSSHRQHGVAGLPQQVYPQLR